MKVKYGVNIIDLERFPIVECQKSLLGDEYGYTVEAIFREQSSELFGSSVKTYGQEICRTKYEHGAIAVKEAIKQASLNDKDEFDLLQWLKSRSDVELLENR